MDGRATIEHIQFLVNKMATLKHLPLWAAKANLIQTFISEQKFENSLLTREQAIVLLSQGMDVIDQEDLVQAVSYIKEDWLGAFVQYVGQKRFFEAVSPFDLKEALKTSAQKNSLNTQQQFSNVINSFIQK